MPPLRTLFVTYGGGHVNIVLRVLEANAALGHPLSPHVLALSTAAPKLRALGVESFGFRELVVPSRDGAALALGEELARQMHTDGLGIARDESVAYLGLSMAELRDRAGSSADALLERFGRAVWCPISTLSRAIARVAPDVVVATNSPRAERAALLAAATSGIPTIRIEDLFARTGIIRPIREGLGDKAGSDLVGRQEPSAIAVMSELARDAAIGYLHQELVEAPRKRVHITGQPELERALTRGDDLPAASTFREQLRLPTDRPVLLWATDNLDVDRPLMQALAQWAAVRDDVHLCVKLHPGPSAATATFFAAFAGRNISIASSGDIHDYIVASSATLSHFSTVGLEAQLIGRPHILVDLADTPELPDPYRGFRHFYDGTIPFLRPGAQSVIERLSGLPGVLDTVLADPSPTLLTPERTPPRGSGSELVRLIQAVARGSSLQDGA